MATPPAPSVVIIGGGHSGFQVAKSLREGGFQGSVTIVDSQDELPYQRPPLSKAHLQGDRDRAALEFVPREFFTENDITIQSACFAEAIDRAEQTVTLSTGERLRYDHLVLATGANPRPLTVPGVEATGVYTLRTLADADALSEELDHATQIVVVGAGFIGLEFVAAAIERRIPTTVIEFAPRPLGRATSAPVGNYFADHYRQQGVTLLCDTGVTAIEAADPARPGRVSAVIDSGGDRHAADLVVVGVGVLPNTVLAERAGLKTDNGVVVDEYLRTSDPAIFAIGDCSSYPSAFTDRRVRLESVQNATDQARMLARTICGQACAFAEVPWFWSDQGAKKLQIAGLNFDADTEVVRGSVEAGQFSVFQYAGDRLLAVDSVDRPMDHMSARRIIAAGANISPSDAADLGFDLKGYAREAYAQKSSADRLA